MKAFSVSVRNTVLFGEHRTYTVLANGMSDAEKKAIKQMRVDLGDKRGKNYVDIIELLGTPLR